MFCTFQLFWLIICIIWILKSQKPLFKTKRSLKFKTKQLLCFHCILGKALLLSITVLKSRSLQPNCVASDIDSLTKMSVSQSQGDREWLKVKCFMGGSDLALWLWFIIRWDFSGNGYYAVLIDPYKPWNGDGPWNQIGCICTRNWRA